MELSLMFFCLDRPPRNWCAYRICHWCFWYHLYDDEQSDFSLDLSPPAGLVGN